MLCSLTDVVAAATGSVDLAGKLRDQGMDVFRADAASFSRLIETDLAKWAEVVRAAAPAAN